MFYGTAGYDVNERMKQNLRKTCLLCLHTCSPFVVTVVFRNNSEIYTFVMIMKSSDNPTRLSGVTAVHQRSLFEFSRKTITMTLLCFCPLGLMCSVG